MGTITTNIEQFFRQNSILSRLIAINIILFLFLRFIGVIEVLFSVNIGIMQYIELPSDIEILLYQPWSLLTYMFAHYDFWHILFNLLWLFWFGKIFLLFFNPKQMGGLYILGGLAGGLFYILAYNFIPYFKNAAGSSYLIGASASVMAIIFGTAFYKKDFEVRLLFIGNVKIIYIAIISLIVDILALTSMNGGGHVAHIGGGLTGIVYAYYQKRGVDPTSWINAIIDSIVNLFKKRPPTMKVKHNRFDSEYDYNANKNASNQEVDEILDKIKKSGYSSLNDVEKRKLFDASKK